MAKQVSLIFVPRAKTKAETEIHANMCRQGLIFYSVYSRMDLSHEDRENLLKLMLGATDCVLNPAPGVDISLCKCLAGEMLHTLFDVWLFSKTKNDYLWGILRSSYAKWVYLPETVKEWSASIKGLLNYIIDELYFPEKNTKSVRITCGCFSTGLELPKDYIHYAWNRVVPLLGNANTIKDSEPHKLAMIGISDAIQIMLSLVEAEIPGAPDANTILDLFGHDLFEAAYTLQPRHEAGTAIAITTLCKVFTTCRAVSSDKRYLAAYYNAIRSCLGTSEGSSILINTLQNTELLLTQGLPGARLLVPHYVRMLERIADSPLLADANRAGNGEALISSCINVLSMILSVGTRYQGAKFPAAAAAVAPAAAGDVQAPAPAEAQPGEAGDEHSGAVVAAGAPQASQGVGEIGNYNDLEAHLGQILAKLLKNETLLTTTVESVLWQSYVFMREYLPPTVEYGIINTKTPEVGLQVAPRYAWTFLTHVIRKICDNSWPTDVVKTALEVLGTVTTLYDYLVDPAAYATRIVESLAFYITDKVAGGISGDQAAVSLVVAAFDVAMRWAMTGQWLPDARAVFAHLVETCLVCAGGNTRVHTPDQPTEIVDAALQCFFAVINKWGVYPSMAGASRLSPLMNEEMFIRRAMERYELSLPDALSCVRHYALGNTALITFVDVPELAERDGLTTVVIVRDRTGKYLWRAQFQVFSAEEEAARAQKKDGDNAEGNGDSKGEQCSVPHRSAALHAHSDATNAAEATQMWMQELYASLDAIGVENILPAVSALTSAQAKFGEESHYFLAESAAVRAPEHEAPGSLVTREPARSVAGRALSAQLGYLTPYGHAGLTPLDPCSDFYAALRYLDGLPERDTLRVGVMFQKAGMGERESLTITEDKCSQGFKDFVESLGWLVNTADHTGFLGGIDRKGSMGKHTLYYADHATEVAFHVAPFINDENKNNSDDSDDKKEKGEEKKEKENASEAEEKRGALKRRLIAKDYVLIVWSDDGSYDDSAFPNMQQNVKIIISPVPRGDGLYKVVVRCSDRLRAKPGPLRGTMMVSRRALGPLVRLTAISGHNAVADIVEGTVKPFTLRQTKITEIVKAHKTDIPPAQLFASQFFYDPQAHTNVTFPPRTITHRQRSRPVMAQQAPQISTLLPPPQSSATPVVATPPLGASSGSPGVPPHHPQQGGAIPTPSTLTLSSNSQQQQQQPPIHSSPSPSVASRTNIGPPVGPPPPPQQKMQGSGSGANIPPPLHPAGKMNVKRVYSGIMGSGGASPIGPPPPQGPAPVAGGAPPFKTQANAGVNIPPPGGVTRKSMFNIGHPPVGAAPLAPGQKGQGNIGHPPAMLGGNRMPPHGTAPQAPTGMKTNINFKNSPILQKQYAHPPQGGSFPRGAAPPPPGVGAVPPPGHPPAFGVKRQFSPPGPAPPAPN